jgi:hypothetical protein
VDEDQPFDAFDQNLLMAHRLEKEAERCWLDFANHSFDLDSQAAVGIHKLIEFQSQQKVIFPHVRNF